jgi:hypothetical protein
MVVEKQAFLNPVIFFVQLGHSETRVSIALFKGVQRVACCGAKQRLGVFSMKLGLAVIGGVSARLN